MDEKLREDLNALVDGVLDSERETQLRAQIESQADLKAEFDRLRRVRALVRALPAARANVADSVREALPPESFSENATGGRVIRPWRWARWAVGGIAAVAAVLLVAIALQPPAAVLVSEESTTISRLPKPSGDDRDDSSGAPASSAPVRLERGLVAGDESKADVPKELGVQSTMPTERGGEQNGIEEEQEDSGASDGDQADEAMGSSEAGSSEAGTSGARARKPSTRKPSTPKSSAPKFGAPKAKAQTKDASVVSILSRVERAGTILSRAERNRYFAEIATMKTVTLRAHLDRMGPATVGAAMGRTKKGTEAKKARLSGSAAGEPDSVAKKLRTNKPRTEELNLTAIDEEDADAIVRTLSRVFVASSGKNSTGASTLGTTRDRKAKESHLRLDATASGIATLESWLRRVGLLSAGARAVVRKGGLAGRTGVKSAKESRVRADSRPPDDSDRAGSAADRSAGSSATRAPKKSESKSEPRTRLWIRVRYGAPPSSGSADD